jgi:glycerol-3-phosphate dehydrogenase (NAD(P)+)
MLGNLAVLGAGSWGTALAIALCGRFEQVSVWVRDSRRAEAIQASRENSRYLPGFLLPSNVHVSADLARSVFEADILVSAIPSHHLRTIISAAVPALSRKTQIVSATKGIEQGSLLRMSQILSALAGNAADHPIAVLSGPTFAKEVAAGEPAAVVIACEDGTVCERIQQAFSTQKLRLYASNDVIGTEIGAALKNVIALGAGICSGLGLGSNSVAALVTRGLAEITRLAVAMGGQSRTLSGLAGLGDLVLTATGDLSRNRFVGIRLGQGHSLESILGEMTMVAEGVTTCKAAYQLGLNYGIDMPITNEMHAVLYGSKDPRLAIRDLMRRPLTNE